jgi:hypothetical protein
MTRAAQALAAVIVLAAVFFFGLYGALESIGETIEKIGQYQEDRQ